MLVVSPRGQCWALHCSFNILTTCSGSKLSKLVLFGTQISFALRWFTSNIGDHFRNEQIKKYGSIVKLSLNLKKQTNEVKIQIDGVDMERVIENKFNGVTTDEKLNWKSHIKYLHSKVSRSIEVLNKAKQVLDHKSLYILDCSLVSPYLSYCVVVGDNNYKSIWHLSLSCFKKEQYGHFTMPVIVIIETHYLYDQKHQNEQIWWNYKQRKWCLKQK